MTLDNNKRRREDLEFLVMPLDAASVHSGGKGIKRDGPR